MSTTSNTVIKYNDFFANAVLKNHLMAKQHMPNGSLEQALSALKYFKHCANTFLASLIQNKNNFKEEDFSTMLNNSIKQISEMNKDLTERVVAKNKNFAQEQSNKSQYLGFFNPACNYTPYLPQLDVLKEYDNYLASHDLKLTVMS